MTAKIGTRTVIDALYVLNRRYGRWPTSQEIADYLEVDRAVVVPHLRELNDRRMFRSRQRQGRKVWQPWEAA